MAVLLPEDEVFRYVDGGLLLAGMFAVPRKAESERLVFGRRPQNQGVWHLKWTRLPFGPQLVRMVVGPGEVVRGSGDDLRTLT